MYNVHVAISMYIASTKNGHTFKCSWIHNVKMNFSWHLVIYTEGTEYVHIKVHASIFNTHSFLYDKHPQLCIYMCLNWNYTVLHCKGAVLALVLYINVLFLVWLCPFLQTKRIAPLPPVQTWKTYFTMATAIPGNVRVKPSTGQRLSLFFYRMFT